MSIQAELAQIGAHPADQTRGGVIAATDGTDDWVVSFGVVDERRRPALLLIRLTCSRSPRSPNRSRLYRC